MLRADAGLRLVYRHCIHSLLCDTYWVDPELVDVAALNTTLGALRVNHSRTFHLLRDRMGSHIVRNNKRCTAAPVLRLPPPRNSPPKKESRFETKVWS